MERLLNLECDVKSYSPLPLAFIGDSVFELLVRERLICGGNMDPKRLHAQSVEQVRCEAQAAALDRLTPMLTEEELDQARRGRNAHPAHTPRNADPAVYHQATGLEALFGYLYLKGEIARIRELFAVGCPDAGAEDKRP